MNATVKLRAVHEYMKFSGDDEEPLRASHWMDPESPIVHWFVPRHDDEFYEIEGDEPVEVVLPLVAAARLITEWPGAVWDHSEGEWSTIDYQYGVEHNQTLFVDGPAEVWAVVEVMERRRDDRLRQLRERSNA